MSTSNMYNLGSATGVPEEIKGWNWGAFFLGWFWAIAYRVWVGVLAIIPGIGFFVAIYLGIKGNELAWQSGNWQDVDKFKAGQKTCGIIGLVFWIVMISAWTFVGRSLYQTHKPFFAMPTNSISAPAPAAASSSQSPAAAAPGIVAIYPGAQSAGNPGVYTTADAFPKVVGFYAQAGKASGGNYNGGWSSEGHGVISPSGTAHFTWSAGGKNVSVTVDSQTGTPTTITIVE